MSEQDIQTRAYYYVCKGYGKDSDKNYNRAKKIQHIIDLNKQFPFANHIVEEYSKEVNECYNCRYMCKYMSFVHEGPFAIYTGTNRRTEYICDDCLINEYEATVKDFPNTNNLTQFGWFIRRLVMIYKLETDNYKVPVNNNNDRYANEIDQTNEINHNIFQHST